MIYGNELDAILIDGTNNSTYLSKTKFENNENWAFNASGYSNSLVGDSLEFISNGAGLRSERSDSPIDLFDVTFTNNTGNAIQTSSEYSHVTLESHI